MAAGLNVFVSIGAKIGSGFGSTVNQVERRFDKLAQHVKLRSAEMKAHMMGFQNSFNRFSTNVSLPAGLLVGAGARAVYEWSKVGNELQAVTQMSAQSRKDIEAIARGLLGNPAQNLSAALDLARTGFTDEQIRGTLATTIKLSRADSSVDQASAADIMTNVMKGMKMPDGNYAETVASAERVANNLAFGAAQSSTDVRLMGESFKYAGPMAARLGIDIETLTGMFMTMADNGIKGSESGVALRSGMVRLLKPTKDAMAILGKYNMHLENYVSLKEKLTGKSLAGQLEANGFKANARELQAILNSDLTGGALVQRISESIAQGMGDGAQGADLDAIANAVTTALTGGIDKMDFAKFVQDATAKGWNAGDFARFFDVRQGTRLSTLFGPDMVKNIERVRAAMRGMGADGSFLDKMYAMQMQGAVGPWERMKQAFGNLFISMAESGVMDTVANALDRIAAGVMWLSKSNPTLLKFGTYLLIAAAAAAPIGYIFSGLTSIIGLFRSTLGILNVAGLGPLLARLVPLRTAMVFVRYGFMAALGVSWPLVAAIAAIGLAIAWVIAKWDGIVAFFQGFKQGFMDALGPEAIGYIKAGFAAVDAALTPMKMLFQALWEYGIKPAWEWLQKMFAPADVEKWGSAGRSFGSIIGGMVNGLANFISTIGTAISKIKEFFSANDNAPAGANFAPRGRPTPGRALGGSVSAGRMYQWHERGREYFVPGRSGTVIDAATVAAINRTRGGSGGVNVGNINIYGATDPQAVAVAVRGELNRLAGQQSALLSD